MRINWQLGIGFTGAEGSGKTTLVTELGRQLNVATVHSSARHVLKQMDLRFPPAFGDDSGTTTLFQEQLFKYKTMEEKFVQSPFLADRTTIDMFCYASSALSRVRSSQDFLQDYKNKCVDHAKAMYHFHFVVPSGRFEITADGLRNTLPHNAMTMYYMMLGMLTDLRLPLHVLESRTIQERVDEVVWVLYNNGFIV